VLFDHEVRKGWKGLAPVVVEKVRRAGVELKVEDGVRGFLEKDGTVGLWDVDMTMLRCV
jgi:hypothetical protein